MKLTAKKFPFLEDYRLPHGYDLIKRKRKLSEDQFKIITLGDNQTLRDGGIIIPAILNYGIDALIGLFSPNQRLTAEHVAQAYPGVGYWHDKMRAKILRHNSWVKDVTNPNQQHFEILIQELVHENLSELSGGTYRNLDTTLPAGVLAQYVQIFWDKISKEKAQSGNVGNFPIGNTSGFSIDKIFSGTNNFLMYGIIAGVLFAMFSNKGRRK